MTAGPLDGVRVVEITMFQQGPVAGMRLGDLGADVVKIEAKTGDSKKLESIFLTFLHFVLTKEVKQPCNNIPSFSQ